MNFFKRISTPLRIIFPFALLAVLVAVALPRKPLFKYTYERGHEWKYETLVADFNFPILKTQQQLEQEKNERTSYVTPYYDFRDEIGSDVLARVKTLLEGHADLLELLEHAYAVGVLESDFNDVDAYLRKDISKDVLYLSRDNESPVKSVSDEFYTVDKLREELKAKLKATQLPFVVYSANDAYENIAPLIRKNMYFNLNKTNEIYNASLLPPSPTCGVFYAGDVVISSGEIVTAEIEQLLDSYKTEFDRTLGYSGTQTQMVLGNIMIAIMLATMLYFLVLFIRPYALRRPNELYFIITVFMIAVGAAIVPASWGLKYLYCVPFPVCALYYQAFFKKRFVLPLYILCLSPMLLINHGSTEVFFVHLFAGCFGIISFVKFNKGWRQFISAMIMFVAMVVAYIAFNLKLDVQPLVNFWEILYMFIGAFLCVFAYPLIYLFEIVFRLVSASRLMDLTDTNNHLLRTLAEKAPGTFQHSLAVMNMADAVGREVDADIHLLRAAAMYHDVGKLNNPGCFVENEAPGMDYHSHLSPKESAIEIIKHVTDGVALAERHRIPVVIREFIACHHGTTCTGYFYTKYLNDGGDPENTSAFFYPGPKPKTKEQVILMLCDSLEAASRSLRDYSQESINALVDNIFNDKNASGQYSNSDITLHEVETVKSTLKSYLAQVYHRRIAYPAKKK